MRAVAYLRVSSKGQVDGGGFERQSNAIAGMAARLGHEIVASYLETGVSGTVFVEDRIAFSRMLEDRQSCRIEFDLVLIENIDRLARDVEVSENSLKILRALGIGCIAADTGIDYVTDAGSDPTRVFIRQNLASIAQLFRAQLLQRTAAGRAKKIAETGRCGGGVAYGLLPGEQEMIERIRQLDHFKASEIARILNAEGRRKRNGKPWHRQGVEKILARVGRRPSTPETHLERIADRVFLKLGA